MAARPRGQQVRQALPEAGKTACGIVQGAAKRDQFARRIVFARCGQPAHIPQARSGIREEIARIDAVAHHAHSVGNEFGILLPLPVRRSQRQIAGVQRVVFPQIADPAQREIRRGTGFAPCKKRMAFVAGIKPVAVGHIKGFGKDVPYVETAAHARRSADQIRHKAVLAQGQQGIAHPRPTPQPRNDFHFGRIRACVLSWGGQPQSADARQGFALSRFGQKNHRMLAAHPKKLRQRTEASGKNGIQKQYPHACYSRFSV